MNKRLTISLSMAMTLLAFQPAWVMAQNKDAERKAKTRALAQKIDHAINARLAEADLKAGPKASLAQLTRRLHLDLAGRIPTVVELYDLIDESNNSPTKLEDRIDALLADPTYAYNFSHYWRSVILGGANIQQLAQSQQQFDAWLRARLSDNTTYDKMVKEILTQQGGGGPNRGFPQQPGGPVTPTAFYQVNENKVENLAGATARVFMGIKMECAQCHQHPFASWSRKQFWELAAFFGNGKIEIPNTKQFVNAKYLTGEEPDMKRGNLRVTLADWMTTQNNPYFAKATVDHIWEYFFGVSLIEPILEPTADSPPAHPELLDEMAKEFAASGFDLKFLIRSIVLSDAYQRVSVAYSEASKVELQMFARMPVRGMMPEQLYDSICVATGLRQVEQPTVAQGNRPFNPNQQQNTQKNQFVSMFNSQDRRIETQTSILQALYLMNGPFVRERAGHARTTIGAQNTDTRRRVEAIYMLTLSRMPTASEMERMSSFVDRGGGSGDRAQAVADVCWALLNSSEFLLNH